MRRDADTYVYDDFGAGYFGNVVIYFESEITAYDDQSVAYIFALTNIADADAGDLSSGNDAIYVYQSRSGSNVNIRLGDFNADDSDTRTTAGSSHPHYYFTFERSGSSATLDIYSDPSRQTLVQTLSITCETGTKRYLYALCSRNDSGTPEPAITGYVKNLII